MRCSVWQARIARRFLQHNTPGLLVLVCAHADEHACWRDISWLDPSIPARRHDREGTRWPMHEPPHRFSSCSTIRDLAGMSLAGSKPQNPVQTAPLGTAFPIRATPVTDCWMFLASTPFLHIFVVDGDGVIRQRITGQEPQERVVHRLKATLEQMPQLEGEVRK